MKDSIITILFGILSALAILFIGAFTFGFVVLCWLLWPLLLSLPVWLALKVLVPLFSAVKVTWLEAFCACVLAKVLRGTVSRTTIVNNKES